MSSQQDAGDGSAIRDAPTPYELRVRDEVAAWRAERDGGVVARALGGGMRWIGTHVSKVLPDKLSATVARAVLGALEMLRDGSYWTYSDALILRDAKALGLQIDTLAELRQVDMRLLDRLARKQFTANKVLAALEGAGLGAMGLVAVAADIPLLFGLAFRATQQIGASYGFDMSDPRMEVVVLHVLSAGSATGEAAKAAALTDMHVAAKMFTKSWTYQRIAEETATGVVAQALKEATRRLPAEIARNITKATLAKSIPVVGAVVGGGFNYWFLSSTTRSAYMLFRELHLSSKYG